MKKSMFGLVAASALIAVAGPAMAKALFYNGIECTVPTNQTWSPSTLGLHRTGCGTASCPVTVAPSVGYMFSDVSYAMLYGVNLVNPRLCRRNSSGAITCGTNAAIGSDAWILYKPTGSGTYDDVFVWVNVGSGTSLIREYSVSWYD